MFAHLSVCFVCAHIWSLALNKGCELQCEYMLANFVGKFVRLKASISRNLQAGRTPGGTEIKRPLFRQTPL